MDTVLAGLSYNEKVKYSVEIENAKNNLTDMFFARFRLLYIGLRLRHDPKGFKVSFDFEYERMLEKLSEIKNKHFFKFYECKQYIQVIDIVSILKYLITVYYT